MREDLDSRTATLVLAHLSENNNFPAQVRLVAEQALASRSLCHATGDRGAAPAHRGLHTMITRYTRPEMGRIWSDENKFRAWLEVELAASEALAEMGEVPPEAARLLRQHARFDVARILEIEREVKHDVIAFTTAVAESMARRRPRGSLALVSLRPHLQRCRRYRPGTGGRPGIRAAAQGRRQAHGSPQEARLRVPAHRAGGAHPRRARRAHHLRAEAGPLVRRHARQSSGAWRRPPRT